MCIGHATSVPYLQSMYLIPQIFRVDVQSGGDWSMMASVPSERAMGAFQWKHPESPASCSVRNNIAFNSPLGEGHTCFG